MEGSEGRGQLERCFCIYNHLFELLPTSEMEKKLIQVKLNTSVIQLLMAPWSVPIKTMFFIAKLVMGDRYWRRGGQ